MKPLNLNWLAVSALALAATAMTPSFAQSTPVAAVAPSVSTARQAAGDTARAPAALTRAQVAAETVQFLKTHQRNPLTGEWVDNPAPRAKKDAKAP